MKYLIVLVINITCMSGVFAQQINSKPTYGKLVVQMRDLCGKSIEKVLIQVEGNKIKRKFKSDKQGKFDASLPIGNYRVTINKYGFK